MKREKYRLVGLMVIPKQRKYCNMPNYGRITKSKQLKINSFLPFFRKQIKDNFLLEN